LIYYSYACFVSTLRSRPCPSCSRRRYLYPQWLALEYYSPRKTKPVFSAILRE
jgi:hypothetical protein